MEGTKKGNKITNQSVFGSFGVYSVYTKLVCAHLFGQGKKVERAIPKNIWFHPYL